MNVNEYIKLRQSAIDEYEKELRPVLKVDPENPQAMSVIMLAAAIEAFGKGFDAAYRNLNQ